MWGTDGFKVFTVEEGWGWLFVAAEHWNAECVGWHLCKQGTLFAALEFVSQGLMVTVGSVTADVGRGSGPAYGPWHPVPVGSFPESVETLGHHPQLRLYQAAPNQRRGGTLYPNPQGAGHLWPYILEPAGGAEGGQTLCGHL
jgi:hypothetical protein